LDIAANTATIFTDLGFPSGEPLRGWAFEGPSSTEGGAEEKTIEGVLCRKVTRIGGPLGAGLKAGEGGEIWISDELKYSIREDMTGPESEYAWRLYNIRRSEPPESLFVIPPGYAVVTKSKLEWSR
jgi:hypothetical protein